MVSAREQLHVVFNEYPRYIFISMYSLYYDKFTGASTNYRDIETNSTFTQVLPDYYH